MWKLEGAPVGMHLLQTTFHPCCPLEGSPSSRPKNSCSVHLFCQNGFLCVGLRPVLTDGSHSFILRLMQFFSTTSFSTGCFLLPRLLPWNRTCKKVGLQTGPRSRAQEVKSLLLHSLLFTWGIMVTRKCCVVWDIPLHKAYIIKTERCRNSAMLLTPPYPETLIFLICLNVHIMVSHIEDFIMKIRLIKVTKIKIH